MSERLDTLVRFPTTMNWFGEYDSLQQYIKNDVIVDLADKQTYICIETSAIIGEEPSTSPNWFLFTGSVGGIHTVDIGDALSNVGSATQPIIQNDGVRKVVAGNAVFLSGTPQNTIINSIAVSGFINGLGISINGDEITNSGIRTLGTGGGLYLETPPPNAKISQSNILSVAASSGVTNIGTAQNPILENDYVRSLGLVYLTNNGTASDILLANGGVESIANTDGTLEITGTTTVTIACPSAPESILFASNTTMVPSNWPVVGNPNISPPPTGNISFTLASPLLQSAITNNISYTVTIDMSAICIRAGGAIAPIQTTNAVILYDSTTSKGVSIHLQRINVSATLPIEISFGVLSFDTAFLVANGLTTITSLKFSPYTTNQQWNLLSYGSIRGSMKKN